MNYELVTSLLPQGEGQGNAAVLEPPTVRLAADCGETINWMTVGGGHGWSRTANARSLELSKTYQWGNDSGFIKWCLARKRSDLESCKADELEAVASVSGSTQRAATRTLDGSRSKGDITSYRWTFEPVACTSTKPGDCAGYCKDVGPRPEARKSGARVTIRPLCTIRATLTVSDGDDEDSDPVLVRVTPRSWKTPITYWEDKPARLTLPWVKWNGEKGRWELDLLGGMNDPDPKTCPGQPKPEKESQLLCPLLDDSTSWNGKGYTLATLSDPDGPFDGYSYVASSTLAVRMVGVLNQFLFPDAVTEIDGNNFYTYNKQQGANVDGFLKALSQHEGWGAPGKPHTGHAQAVKEALAKEGNDPRREIEQLLGQSASTVQQKADEKIQTLDTRLNTNTCDKGPGCGHLNEIGKFDLSFFRPMPTSYNWDKTTITVT